MSGFCAIVHLDRARLDRSLLEKMTEALAFRGPDAQQIWAGACAGLGYTHFQTSQTLPVMQPLKVGNRVVIAADARIDGQAELKATLSRMGHAVGVDASDAELIAIAYLAWGNDCVRHLIGDFSFVLWDESSQSLFCARDQFGIKPLFYARAGAYLVVSNTLDCVRVHPAVSDVLDEMAMADFLLFESSQDPAATIYAGIRRVPSAHQLSTRNDAVRVDAYWSIPEWPTSHRPRNDYVEQFTWLLTQSIRDRLRTDKVALEMSGGLDSTAIAALVMRERTPSGKPVSAHAFSVALDRIIPDKEPYFAQAAARHIGIPIHFISGNEQGLFGYQAAGGSFPEPKHVPEHEIADALSARMSGFARVALTGVDGDTLLNESPKPYFRSQLSAGQLNRVVMGVVRYALMERRILPLGWKRSASGAKEGPAGPIDGIPKWLNPTFVELLDLRERWSMANRKAPEHATRPYAHKALTLIQSTNGFFDLYDAAWTRRPIEYRHPFMDLRLVAFCLSMPPLPWAIKKRVLRKAMAGLLPEEVLIRPKTILAGFPHVQRMLSADSQRILRAQDLQSISQYVTGAIIHPANSGFNPDDSWLNMCPHSLAFWLDSRKRP